MRDVGQQLIQDRIRDLRENTDFVATLFESLIGYAVIAVDFDGNILAYNEGARLWVSIAGQPSGDVAAQLQAMVLVALAGVSDPNLQPEWNMASMLITVIPWAGRD